MSGLINPEAGQPTTTQSFEQSERNPVVNFWGGVDAEGGQIPAPAAAESRMTKAGAGPSANAGLVNYDDRGSADGVEDSAEAQS
jgi:hypothetical protein